MNEKTKEDYRKLAAHFYKNMGESTPKTPKTITDQLLAIAGEYRPASFRRLKNALALDQSEKGFDKAAFRINATVNPMTKKNAPVMLKRQLKKKRKSVDSINPKDLKKMAGAINEKGDSELMAALILVNTLGCRANEIMSVKILEDGNVFISGSKKAEFNANGRKVTRGDVDRVLAMTDTNELRKVKWATETLGKAESGKSGVVHKIQSRMFRLSKKLWPKRSAHMTLKSFRHQMGSDLKASGLDPKTVAYIMGHESTVSVEEYGDKRKASTKRTIAPAIDQEKINDIVRDKTKEQFETRTKNEKVQPRTRSVPGQSMEF